jgi:hypothetical protein
VKPIPQYRLSRQSIDIIFKREAARLVAALPYHLGMDLPPIVAQLPTESPQVDIHLEEMDAVFQLADGSILHLEFQTTQRRADVLRFFLYDARLYAQYRSSIHTVVIYGAGIDDAGTQIDGGVFTYRVRAVFLGRQDGETRLAALREQITAQGTLSTEAQVDLIFLPLMRQTRPMAEVVRDAIDLARVLPIEEQRGTLAALLGLGARFLEQRDLEQLVEGLMSTVTGQQLLEQSFEEGRLSRAREDILTILSARFGTPPEDLRRYIQRLTEPQVLHQMLVVAATASSIDAVRAQLP